MRDLNRLPIWVWLLLPLLGGGVLALAWWDWAYPGQILAWWHGERVYAFYWRQLRWMLLVAEGTCLGLWLPLMVQDARKDRGPLRASSSFLLSFLALAFFARYTFHPLGIQFGSSVWTYGLATATITVLAWPLSRLIGQVATGPGRMSPAPTGARRGDPPWSPNEGRVQSPAPTAEQSPAPTDARRGDPPWSPNEGRVQSPAPTARGRRWGLATIWALAALYALVFGFLSTAQHASFRTHALDTGTMDQAAWNTIHGRILERTPLYRPPSAGSRYENRLLDAKLELIFIPLSALYWLWADPRILLIVQTLCLAVGAVPLYLLVYDRARDAFLAASLSAAYLLYLPLHYVNMAEFHPSALMVPPLIAAWRAMRQGRWRGYYLWLALALCCRIDAAFVVLALGVVIAAWQKGNRRHGAYTALLALAWLWTNFGVVVPAVQRIYGPGAGDLVARRFGALGNDPVGVIQAILAQPASVVTQLANRETLQTLFDLFMPPTFLPLLHPLALVPALPILAINLLAGSAWQNSIHAHYMAPAIPFVWIATGEGLAWLAARRAGRGTGRASRAARRLAVFALLNTALLAVLLSPFPPGKAFRLADYCQPSAYQENLRAAIALIPENASVCAQSDIHPHVSQRRDACLFYRCALTDDQEAEYAILDLDATATKSPLGFHAYYELADHWLERDDYGVIAQKGGVLLFRHGAPSTNDADVRAALDAYGQAFYRVAFLRAQVPARLKARELYRIPITLANTGSQCWSAWNWLPVRLSYRWWTDSGALLTIESLRTDIPHRVEPGNQVRLRAWLLTPPRPGRYTLEWDLLREGDAWFGDKGGATLRQGVTIE